jgi:Fe2+ transport system protein B
MWATGRARPWRKTTASYTYKGTKYTVTDLPGSYGLPATQTRRQSTADFIKSGQADLVCILVDASQLERSMFMVAEFAALDKPAVLLLNMMDVAKAQKRRSTLSCSKSGWASPSSLTAADGKGYGELKELFARELEAPHKLSSVPESAENGSSAQAVLSQSQEKYRWIGAMLEGVTHTAAPEYRLSKFDRIATSPRQGQVPLSRRGAGRLPGRHGHLRPHHERRPDDPANPV